MLFYSPSETLAIVALAIVLDWIVGDPRWLTHPVVLIGRLIARMERSLRPKDKTISDASLKRRGVTLTVATVVISAAVTGAIVFAAGRIHPYLGYACSAWLISTTFAVKGLRDAALLVFRPLARGDLGGARKFVGYIVGRDTSAMDEKEAARAAIETVAENTVDAFLSPLLFALLGGAPAAMFYRAANTLDSMVGYRNERYRHFGWASARFDDTLNYIPARLSAGLFAAAAWLTPGMSPIRAMKAVRAFAHLHPSPNSGIPESAAAGALGIELGGRNVYFGVASVRARMGWPLRPIEAWDIVLTTRLLYKVSIICFLGVSAAWFFTRY